LHYKGLEYETVWVEYPDIETVAKKLGIKPTGVKPDGSDLYTIPMIYDRSTGTGVAHSFQIALYLDTAPQHSPPHS
jgi:hypothetical protein